MSNIKANPCFVPAPGIPTAAPAHFPYSGMNMAEMDEYLGRLAWGKFVKACREAKREGRPKPFFDRTAFVHVAIDDLVY